MATATKGQKKSAKSQRVAQPKKAAKKTTTKTLATCPDITVFAWGLLHGDWAALEKMDGFAHVRACDTCLAAIQVYLQKERPAPVLIPAPNAVSPAVPTLAAKPEPVLVAKMALSLRPAEPPAIALSRQDPEHVHWAETQWAITRENKKRACQWVGFVCGERVCVVTWSRKDRGYIVSALRRRVGIYKTLGQAQEEAMYAATEVGTAMVDFFTAWGRFGEMVPQKAEIVQITPEVTTRIAEFNAKYSAKNRR